ncbi:zinc finger and SCAN domain-containing protein 12-like [Chrysoperla carnea]|uniref:zinc finger and SCAN domain-containing protein 12-like n=1 Tax=Chrysoperla carnea TaxID=189513 RepID=UPI001D0712BE|nr:zinc finger and SCAN domain-containing protein 12-like [Chrysoperla carnea]
MPPQLSLLDFEKICRICLKLDENMIAISVNNIIEMIKECTTVQIWNEDDLPQQVCCICLKRLEDAFNLKNQSENSDKELRKLLNNKDTDFEKNEIQETEIIESTNFLSDNDYDEYSPSDQNESPESRDDFEFEDNNIQSETNDNLDKEKQVPENSECEICGKTFLNKHKLKKHLVAHSNHRPFKCTVCSKAFKENFILNKHVKTMHTNPVPKEACQICGRSISKTSLYRHLKTHENPPSYQCTVCPKKFLDADTLEKHCRRVHKKETSFDLYPFLCYICGKGCISNSELTRHMNTHEKEAKFKCSECGKAYTSDAGLRSHVKGFHLNERPFVCTVCSKAYPTKIILKHHMRTHTGEKPFKCLICMKMFALKCVLKTHMKVHGGIYLPPTDKDAIFDSE